jgi:hypothetical protein
MTQAVPAVPADNQTVTSPLAIKLLLLITTSPSTTAQEDVKIVSPVSSTGVLSVSFQLKP